MNSTVGAARRRRRGTGAVVLTAGGLFTAFAVASCCALPLLLGTLGLGGAWLFTVSSVAAPHRTAVLIVSGAALAIGAVLWWRQRADVCEPGSWCAKPAVRILTGIGLVIGVALWIAGYMYV